VTAIRAQTIHAEHTNIMFCIVQQYHILLLLLLWSNINERAIITHYINIHKRSTARVCFVARIVIMFAFFHHLLTSLLQPLGVCIHVLDIKYYMLLFY